MIVIVDYGMGNLRSVSKALEHLGAKARITSDPRDIEGADKLILPGVGAFEAAMKGLARRKLIEPLKRALASDRPYLGICLGLQLLFEHSEEGDADGLRVLPGIVRRFANNPAAQSPNQPILKIPHMGWNQVVRSQKSEVRSQNGCPLLSAIPEGSFFYFVHSYYADPTDKAVIALESEYGVRFPAMIWRGNLFATQFHPEKSQALGLRLLQNFVDL